MTLTNKNVLITGGARRVGRVMSLAVARAGGNVIIHHGHSPTEAREVKEEIESNGQKAYILQADFSNLKESKNLISRALDFGPLYALVNSAAIFKNNDWSSTSLSDWNAHHQINLTTPYLLSKDFATSIEKGAKGRIINILDWRALRPQGDHFAYTISKAGLAALTKSMAVSLAPDVTVNGLALGAILPPIDGHEENHQEVIDPVPAGRWAELGELEEALIFLLTGPMYITGEILHLDGGRHLT